VLIEAPALARFIADFEPAWDAERGAPDSMTFALWSRLAAASFDGEDVKRLGVDALRWLRNPPAGAELRGRMTVMAKDPVGETKGIVIAQYDLLDQEGRLVFSCLTRSLHRR
jgi:acyl dehydratase